MKNLLNLFLKFFKALFGKSKVKADKMDKLDYFISCLPVSREWGFNDWCIVTHAWHESAGFQKVIGKYNFWGIKKPQKWVGETIPINTHEYIKGKKVAVVDYFIDFATCEQALLWYCGLIDRLYPESFFNRQLPELFFKGLVNGKYKYATDPKYADKLEKLYIQLKDNIRLKNVLSQ